eukprot:TRINITY_DN12414_c0_g1_i1.p1 TRINITY_DN12414_c0_g1~~TRINITY_DN12414_c0_g1_i1.p1  ORF type:complete len:132 (+),score=17.69 TRINITY_DN12414_c0_g1_i1:36-398(+)
MKVTTALAPNPITEKQQEQQQQQTKVVAAICLKGTDEEVAVEQLLAFAKITSSRRHIEPVNSNNVVSQATGIKASRVQKRIRRNRRLSQIHQPHTQITVQESANVPKPSPTKPRVVLYVF